MLKIVKNHQIKNANQRTDFFSFFLTFHAIIKKEKRYI